MEGERGESLKGIFLKSDRRVFCKWRERVFFKRVIGEFCISGEREREIINNRWTLNPV